MKPGEYQPAVGDVVKLSAEGHEGDHGEVELVLAGSVGVRIVQEESAWRGQVVYFNAGQMAPVMKGKGHVSDDR